MQADEVGLRGLVKKRKKKKMERSVFFTLVGIDRFGAILRAHNFF